jgi:hypothetical protein
MRVGDEVRSICRRCGDVWHIVIARADGRIAKAECKQCGARHRYRPSEGEGATRASSRSFAAGSTSPRTRSREAKRIVEADPARPRRPFRPSETYQVGDRVVHQSFGEGVVQVVKGATKIEILFEVGSKILVHGRDG